jgi:hypothetical protein
MIFFVLCVKKIDAKKIVAGDFFLFTQDTEMYKLSF